MPNWLAITLFLLVVLGIATGVISGAVWAAGFLPALPGWLIILLKIGLIVFGFVMLVASLMTLVGDRKQSAKIQNRIGPNRATFFGQSLGGLPHFIADGIKMLFKEDIVPDGAHRTFHLIAPALIFIPALLGFSVIPFMDEYCSTGAPMVTPEYPFELCPDGTWLNYFQVLDLNSGMLFAFAIASIEVYGATIAGWAANNKYSLLGGMRSAAQMISYEVSLGLSLAGLLLIWGTLDLNEMVRLQGKMFAGWIPLWGIVIQPVAFFLFFLVGMAETKRPPFDQPEGESEIVAGYFTEYSSMKFAVIQLAEYVATVFLATLTAVFFLGGWQVPFLYADGFHFGGIGAQPDIAVPYAVVIGMRIVAMLFKVLVVVWLQFMMRWTYPSFRYDQVMTMGWKIVLPLSLANFFVTALIVLIV
jgi:NADH-quinone oxidoreductase subunit H